MLLAGTASRDLPADFLSLTPARCMRQVSATVTTQKVLLRTAHQILPIHYYASYYTLAHTEQTSNSRSGLVL